MHSKEELTKLDQVELKRYLDLTYNINTALPKYLVDTGIREGIIIDVFGSDPLIQILSDHFLMLGFNPESHYLIVIGRPDEEWAIYNKEENMDSIWYKIFESYKGGGAGISATSRLVPLNGDMQKALEALYLNPDLTKLPAPKKD